MDILHEVEVEVDVVDRIRSVQPEEVQRRSKLMRQVRSTYARSTRDQGLRDLFDDLLEDLGELAEFETPAQRTERLEGNMLILIGDSGAGKSTALRRMFRNHPLFPDYAPDNPNCALVTVSAPSHCNLVELGREALNQLGYPLRRSRVDGPEVWRLVRQQVRGQKKILLHFDELQHAVQTVHAPELQNLRNDLKGLLVDPVHPIGLVVSGTWEILPLVHPDRQVARRGYWMEFQRLVAGADDRFIRRFVGELTRTAELEFVAADDLQLASRIMHAGCYQLGVVAEEIQNAIRHCLRRADTCLTRQHFAQAYARRTGNRAQHNPYIADDYRSVDATLVLNRPREEVQTKPEDKGKRR